MNLGPLRVEHADGAARGLTAFDHLSMLCFKYDGPQPGSPSRRAAATGPDVRR